MTKRAYPSKTVSAKTNPRKPKIVLNHKQKRKAVRQ